MPYASNYIEAREATEFNCFFVDEFNSMLRVVPTPLCGHSSVRAVKNELAAGLKYTSAFREKASQFFEPEVLDRLARKDHINGLGFNVAHVSGGVRAPLNTCWMMVR